MYNKKFAALAVTTALITATALTACDKDTISSNLISFSDTSFTGIIQSIDDNVVTGAVVDDETYAGNDGDGYCNIYISDNSKWIVTGNSTVTNLYYEGIIEDANGNTVSIIGTDNTVYVKGTSSYTITVENYDTAADMSKAADGGDFSDYAVEQL